MTTADLWIAMPLLMLACGALVTLIIGSVTRNENCGNLIAIITTVGAAIWSLLTPPALFAPTLGISASSLARIFTTFFCLMAAAVLALSREYNAKQGISGEEYPATILFTTFGMVALASSTNLLTLFLGLEAMTFGFYILVAYDLNNERSGETGMKYLLIGAFSSAFMAFGIALLYCASGTLAITQTMQMTLSAHTPHLIGVAGWSCLLIGIAFKLSLVPAHLWTPDIYEGAPAPVTAFLSGGSKAAALLLLLLLLPHAGDASVLRLPLWWLAFLSMLVGNLTALLQHNVRRMLAYSSIAQMGYVIVAIISGSYQAAAYYAIAYGVISLAAFGSIAVLERTGCGSTLDDYRGRGSSSPLASGVLTLALLALAGIPPTAGFTGKFLIFGSAVRSGEMPLAIFGILTVAVSIYYYLRVVSVLYFTEPKRIDQEQITTIEALVLLIASLVIVLLGLFPSSLLELFTRLSS